MLYLPELLRLDRQQPVFIPEGEKDVDALHQLGFIAIVIQEARENGGMNITVGSLKEMSSCYLRTILRVRHMRGR